MFCLRKLILLVTFLVMIPISSASEEIVYVPGGEVNGVPVSSFYLSLKVVTNQEFFLFIQKDGYKRKELWDTDALEKMDKFKNASGEMAPRTWQGSSPPPGQEHQPLYGISLPEAKAYAKDAGWIIPSDVMWQLAQKASPNIGDYPWKEGSDSINNILMARYYAPADFWEKRFGSMQNNLQQLQQASAKISSVNLNASNIRDISRKVEEQAKQSKEAVQTLQTSTEQKVTDLNTQIVEHQQKTKDQEQRLAKAALQINTIENKLKLWESKVNLVTTLEEKIDKLVLRVDQAEKDKTVLTNQVTELENQLKKANDEHKASTQELNSKILALETKIAVIEDLGKRADSQAERLQKLETLAPSLSEKPSYFAWIQEVQANSDKSFASVQRDITALQESTQGLAKRCEKQEGETAKLFKLSTELGGSGQNLSKQLADMENQKQQLDAQNKAQLAKMKDSIQVQIDSLQQTDDAHNKKHSSLDQQISNLQKRDESFDTSLQNTKENLEKNILLQKNSDEAARKQLYENLDKDWNKKLDTISLKVNTNSAENVSLGKKLSTSNANFTSNMDSLTKRVALVEEKQTKITSDLSVGAVQLKRNMMELGAKMQQMFQVDLPVGMEIDPKLLPKEEDKPKEEDPKEEPVVEKVVEKVIEKTTVLDKTAIAELCHHLGKVYQAAAATSGEALYQNLALECWRLALKFDENNQQSKDSLEKNWEELNTPLGMIHIPGGDAKLGSVQNQSEFPYQETFIPSFYIDTREVTRGEYQRFIDVGGYRNLKNWSEEGNVWIRKNFSKLPIKPLGWKRPKKHEENLPAVNVNYYEAEAFAKWSGKSLPTPEQWEYAARGIDFRLYPWGEQPFTHLPKHTVTVDQYEEDISVFGVYGMGTNVSEWCAGTFQRFKNGEWKKEPAYNTVKGGSYKGFWYQQQTHYKYALKGHTHSPEVGFRCVKEVPSLD